MPNGCPTHSKQAVIYLITHYIYQTIAHKPGYYNCRLNAHLLPQDVFRSSQVFAQSRDKSDTPTRDRRCTWGSTRGISILLHSLNMIAVPIKARQASLEGESCDLSQFLIIKTRAGAHEKSDRKKWERAQRAQRGPVIPQGMQCTVLNGVNSNTLE
jgi:hypothetical protein